MSGTARVFLEITTGKRVTLYRVVPIDADPRVATRAWRLWKPGNKKFYDVAITDKGHLSCTCPDFIWRHKFDGCKHCGALRALGLLPKER